MLQLIFDISCLICSSILNLLIFIVKGEPLWAQVGVVKEITQKSDERKIDVSNGKIVIGVKRLKDKSGYQILRVPELLKSSRLRKNRGEISGPSPNHNYSSSPSFHSAIGSQKVGSMNREKKSNAGLKSRSTTAFIRSQKIDGNSRNTKKTTLITNVKTSLDSKGGRPSMQQHENQYYTSFKTSSSTMNYKIQSSSPLQISSFTNTRPSQSATVHNSTSSVTTNSKKTIPTKKTIKFRHYERSIGHSPMDRQGHCARCFKA
ncbi:hypothetical protein EV44_g0250 [Erysiphe necator]|uniref:Uncharacterized protein n=1 Tax=Uncinula necator TaxID=52586 RepID=A0A0B1P9E2_UNCNE|nr:hypothetical protein EV44_g0250 [Erysiphe necator]